MRRILAEWRFLAMLAACGLVALLAATVVASISTRSKALDTIAARDRQLTMLRRQLADRDATAAAERARLNDRVDQLLAALRTAGITPPAEPAPPGQTTVVVTPAPATTTTTATRPTTTTSSSSTTTTTKPPAPCTTLPLTGACLGRNTPNHR